MAISQRELIAEQIFEVISSVCTQIVDRGGEATYTFDDDDRDELLERLTDIAEAERELTLREDM